MNNGRFRTLIPAPHAGSGLTYFIKKIDGSANAVTVVPPSGPTIEGASSVVLSSQWSMTNLLALKTSTFVKLQ